MRAKARRVGNLSTQAPLPTRLATIVARHPPPAGEGLRAPAWRVKRNDAPDGGQRVGWVERSEIHLAPTGTHMRRVSLRSTHPTFVPTPPRGAPRARPSARRRRRAART